MKRFLTASARAGVVGLAASAALTFTTLVAQAQTVTLDGTSVPSVVSRAGSLLIPFRAPMERLGATVDYNKPTATATMGGQQLVTINTGDTSATIRGNPTTLRVAPALIDGNAYVPVDVLSAICGARVTYSPNRQSATVNGCTLAGLNAAASALPAPAAAPAAAPNFWPWLIGLILLALLIALIAWLLRRREKEVVTTNVYSQTGRVAGETTPGAPRTPPTTGRRPDDTTRP
jgi:hypothetical protein